MQKFIDAIKAGLARLKAHWALMPLPLKIGAPAFVGLVVAAILVSILVKSCGH